MHCKYLLFFKGLRAKWENLTHIWLYIIYMVQYLHVGLLTFSLTLADISIIIGIFFQQT